MSASSSTSITIKINSEHVQLVYPLSDLEYQILKNSIKEVGLHYPIIVNLKGDILDGYHRYKICKELGFTQSQIKYEVKDFDDPLEEKRFVIDINLKRRQLNDFQKAELAYKLKEIESEKARLRRLNNLKNVNKKLSTGPIDHIDNNNSSEEQQQQQQLGRTREIVSKKTGISQGTYERAKAIIEKAPEEVKEKLRKNNTTISKEYEKLQRDQKRFELLSQMNNKEPNDNNNNVENNVFNNNCKIFHGDFTELQKEDILKDNSIDLIFTDPPYGKEYLSLYYELASLAVKVLKPGGNIVFFVGHIILDQVIKIFHDFSLKKDNNDDCNNIGLKYWWTFAVKHSGHHQKIYPRHVFAEWKPLLWYIKGERANSLKIFIKY